MSESVLIVAPLADADAVAVRSGDDVLIHVSPAVPGWARDAIVADLNLAVSLAPQGPVRVSLPVGAAVELAAQPIEALSATGPRPAALRAAVLAALVLPLGALTAASLGGVGSGVAPVMVAPEVSVAWPTKPNPHRQPLSTPLTVAGHSASTAVPVSIHPPAAIARAAPRTVGAPAAPNNPPSAAPAKPQADPPTTLSAPVSCPAPPQLLNDPAPAPKAEPAPDATPAPPSDQSEPAPAPESTEDTPAPPQGDQQPPAQELETA